ncbi:MAG: short chain dehydrogenase [Methanoregula sp. PtaB.Bin085]|nr:MAG: short chain dehydrogenase [Methanoregula sp. PtaB.Bin085]
MQQALLQPDNRSDRRCLFRYFCKYRMLCRQDTSGLSSEYSPEADGSRSCYGRKRDDILRQRSYTYMNPPAVRYITANGITIAYQQSGSDGPPLILINGFASTMDTWNPPFLEPLAQRFRIIVFDNRGTGYTSAGEIPFSLPLFAQDTLALMDALGISRAHILGLSMGASIAQELVLAHPGRVDRLVLISGTCGGEHMVMMQPEIWARLSDKSGTGVDVADRMFSVLFPKNWLASHDPWQHCPDVRETTPEHMAAQQAEALFRWPGSFDRLPAIRCPVLVVTGAEDVVIPPQNSRILADRITGSRLVEFPGAGHGLQYQCPRELAGAVLAFLTAVRE